MMAILHALGPLSDKHAATIICADWPPSMCSQNGHSTTVVLHSTVANEKPSYHFLISWLLHFRLSCADPN